MIVVWWKCLPSTENSTFFLKKKRKIVPSSLLFLKKDLFLEPLSYSLSLFVPSFSLTFVGGASLSVLWRSRCAIAAHPLCRCIINGAPRPLLGRKHFSPTRRPHPSTSLSARLLLRDILFIEFGRRGCERSPFIIFAICFFLRLNRMKRKSWDCRWFSSLLFILLLRNHNICIVDITLSILRIFPSHNFNYIILNFL